MTACIGNRPGDAVHNTCVVCEDCHFPGCPEAVPICSPDTEHGNRTGHGRHGHDRRCDCVEDKA